VYVGQILSIERHPDADKIVVCQTDVGGEQPLQICCGATNMQVGDKVPTAVDGATLPGDFKIANRKMRGVESQGMMCSARELGVGDGHAGLLILPADVPVGADIRGVLGLDDVVFEIEVTPNRADWASMIGVARELAAKLGAALRLPAVSLVESERDITEVTSVTVEDSLRCRRYLGRVIEGVSIMDSPEWLAARLRAAGQRPINNVVDVTNLVLLETGQPLHAFDLDKMQEQLVVVRTATAGEKIRTLDGEERSLDEEMLVIADAERPQCVAGVMGGAESEVATGTTRIFLESAWFQPQAVRRASRKLNLISESSQRFQRGADPDMAAWAIDRAAQLIQAVAGGEILRGVIDVYPEPFTPVEVTLRYERANALLGSNLSLDRQRAHLEALGFELLSADDAASRYRVPLRRNDVSREADLIEEIARVEGFDNLPNTLPRVRAMSRVMAPGEKPLAALRHRLVDAGLTEIRNWSFVSVDAMRRAQLDLPLVMLENPLSEKQAAMRPSLLPAMLESAAYNLNRGAQRVALFEVAPVYFPAEEEDELPIQRQQLGVILAGGRLGLHWSSGESPAVDFFDIKGIAEHVAGLHVTPVTFAESSLPCLQAGQAVDVLLDGQKRGSLGKLDAAVARSFDIERPVFVMFLDIDDLLAREQIPAQAREISAFPASVRDIAVLVDANLPAAELTRSAMASGGGLLQQAEVFDIYAGKNLPEGKKSVALRLTFQSFEATLTDKKVGKAYDKIVKTLEHQFQATLR
jgi:phenylalanyl-tRNA synthetase beta chain